MKKVFSLILLTAFLLSTVSACTNKSEQLPSASPSPSATPSDKPTITIGTLSGTDYYNYLVYQTTLYNAANRDTRIELIDYGNAYEQASITRAQTEIVSGNIPDMLMLRSMPAEKYAEKGLFLDLNTFLDAPSGGVKREDLFSGPLKAMEYNGSLYWISPEFLVETYIGLPSVVGEHEGLAIDEMLSRWEAFKGPGRAFMYADQLIDIFYMLIQGGLCNQFIDYPNSTCNFDNQEFIELLKLCKGLAGIDAKVDQEDPRAMLLDQSLFLYFFKPFGFHDYANFISILRQRDYTLVGLPGTVPAQSLCDMILPLSITSSCENTDIAWDFITYLLHVEHRYIGNFGFCIPLNMNILDKYVRVEKKYQTIWNAYDKSGESALEKYASQTPFNGESVKIYPILEEEYLRYLEIINTATIGFLNSQGEEKNIVIKEAFAYFNNNQSAEETASIIQDKVTIYLSEQANSM